MLIAPGELLAVEAAARGELPLGFGRIFLAAPTRVRFVIFLPSLFDRVAFNAVK